MADGELKPLLMPVIQRLISNAVQIERNRLYSVVSAVPAMSSVWSYRAHVLAALSAATAAEDRETPLTDADGMTRASSAAVAAPGASSLERGG